jgi:hypothetical protein
MFNSETPFVDPNVVIPDTIPNLRFLLAKLLPERVTGFNSKNASPIYIKRGRHGTSALNAQVDNASFLSPSGDLRFPWGIVQ